MVAVLDSYCSIHDAAWTNELQAILVVAHCQAVLISDFVAVGVRHQRIVRVPVRVHRAVRGAAGHLGLEAVEQPLQLAPTSCNHRGPSALYAWR